jgi:hypothetical protein
MAEQSVRVLVFSHKAEVREAIVNAVGRRPAADLRGTSTWPSSTARPSRPAASASAVS